MPNNTNGVTRSASSRGVPPSVGLIVSNKGTAIEPKVITTKPKEAMNIPIAIFLGVESSMPLLLSHPKNPKIIGGKLPDDSFYYKGN